MLSRLKFTPLAFSLTIALALQGQDAHAKNTVASSFVTTRGGLFYRNGEKYAFVGANFWAAMNLASTGTGGDRKRLINELDRLQNLGIRNLRILGASEGPDTAPWRVSPALQKSPGVYDQDLLRGLDFLLVQMKKHDMTAVIMLNNFWQWSGGMAQYLYWADNSKPIPYPPAQGWVEYTSRFYSNAKAVGYYNEFVKKIVSRTNSISKIKYASDPTIMAWELANEPRGGTNRAAFNKWIADTSGFIKSIDHNHLVTTGVEGDNDNDDTGLNLIWNHSSKNIDYATFHVWVENVGQYNPADPVKTFQPARDWAKKTIDHHRALQTQLLKPLVLEEFGLARDEGKRFPGTAVSYRDIYFAQLFKVAYVGAKGDETLAGINFWAWGGEAAPTGKWWKVGDPLIGDPAHEPQGWYSIFSTDDSTLKVIKAAAQKLNQLK